MTAGAERGRSRSAEGRQVKYRFFSIPIQEPQPAEAELNAFCAGRRIAAIEKHFVADGASSLWAFCVGYLDSSPSVIRSREKVDYREVLSETDFSVYAKLRNLRKSFAEEEGIPAYAVFTNEQLAAMVRSGITSLKAMAKIDGVGKSRLDKYGKAFLEILKRELPLSDSDKAKEAGRHEANPH